MTHMPRRTFSPFGFDSVASSNTMFKKTYLSLSFVSLPAHDFPISDCAGCVLHTSYPLNVPITFLEPFNWTSTRLSRYYIIGLSVFGRNFESRDFANSPS